MIDSLTPHLVETRSKVGGSRALRPVHRLELLACKVFSINSLQLSQSVRRRRAYFPESLSTLGRPVRSAQLSSRGAAL